MKVSGFTFLRNGIWHGYPFVASIQSLLPIVDEFVLALGPSDDGTEEMVRAIGDPKIRIIPTQWNERVQDDDRIQGFVYGQQKSIALFNCTGDWAFYLEGDEVLHEDDLPKIRATMERHLNREAVEAMYFDYLHFYGNRNTIVCSPAWHRAAPRILRNTIPAWAPRGLSFVVLSAHKYGRYPRATHGGGTIYHYGHLKAEDRTGSVLGARPEDPRAPSPAGSGPPDGHHPPYPAPLDLAAIDPVLLRPFAGTHPRAVQSWLPPAQGLFRSDPGYRITARDMKHRWMLRFESWFGVRFARRYYRPVG